MEARESLDSTCSTGSNLPCLGDLAPPPKLLLADSPDTPASDTSQPPKPKYESEAQEIRAKLIQAGVDPDSAPLNGRLPIALLEPLDQYKDHLDYNWQHAQAVECVITCKKIGLSPNALIMHFPIKFDAPPNIDDSTASLAQYPAQTLA